MRVVEPRYPGITTLVMSAQDMGARAQQLRNHAYVMSDTAIPKHNIPPAPVITSTVLGGLIAWRGSAGMFDTILKLPTQQPTVDYDLR